MPPGATPRVSSTWVPVRAARSTRRSAPATRRLTLGTFDTVEQAAHAYDAAAWRLERPRQQLNFKDCASLAEAEFLAGFDGLVTAEQSRLVIAEADERAMEVWLPPSRMTYLGNIDYFDHEIVAEEEENDQEDADEDAYEEVDMADYDHDDGAPAWDPETQPPDITEEEAIAMALANNEQDELNELALWDELAIQLRESALARGGRRLLRPRDAFQRPRSDCCSGLGSLATASCADDGTSSTASVRASMADAGVHQPPIMANTFPKRTLRKVEGWLGDYDGPITALLCGMLKELHCDPRIPVIKYTYYDGEILAKCRVSVQLPEKLLMSRIMPYGEAKTITTAYHMGLFKAILEIRQHNPEAAAQHMDSCKSLLTTMYLLHMKMRGEIDHMLAEFTDPDKVQTRMHGLRAQPQHTTPFFNPDSDVDLSDQWFKRNLPTRDSLTPNFVPHYPHVSASYDTGYGGDHSWNINCSESPIENSTGWRFGEPFGDEEEPIPCDTGDESDAVNPNVNQSFEQKEKDTNSISLDLEMGLPKTSQYVVGESSGTKKKKKKKMRGQVNRNPPWMTGEEALYSTGDMYESLSSYFGMTDLCLGLGEMALVETEEARREREAREKEEADAAARAENAPPPPHPMLHPDFQQYMRSMEEDRRRYQESQSKNMQDFFTHVINDRVHPPDKVFTWEEFKKKFRDAHVPDSVVELKKREELRQNTAPIMQYVRDFNRLSRYAPEDVDTEEKRKKRFMKGMNPYMKMQLRLARTAEFRN
ncbi:hypothetical protein QYE76_035856 [Lolium multiflorum]|uniref:AP2/ERF domain-containing protein n=1 Tax=Lolium multiflorum TaxID=4521 RepID=A0AAD8VPM2_LOLMU|nr:hypothetical protein QYE76_035856 [Lolium multiflorum]